MRRTLIATIALLIGLSPLAALSLGVGVTPSVIEANLRVGERHEVALSVANSSAEPGIYRISADEHAEWFAISPSELKLEGGERAQVMVTIAPKIEGAQATNLTVAGFPLDQRAFSASSGIKIPVRLLVAPADGHARQWWAVVMAFSLIIAAAIVSIGVMLYHHFHHRTIWDRIQGIFR